MEHGVISYLCISVGRASESAHDQGENMREIEKGRNVFEEMEDSPADHSTKFILLLTGRRE